MCFYLLFHHAFYTNLSNPPTDDLVALLLHNKTKQTNTHTQALK